MEEPEKPSSLGEGPLWKVYPFPLGAEGPPYLSHSSEEKLHSEDPRGQIFAFSIYPDLSHHRRWCQPFLAAEERGMLGANHFLPWQLCHPLRPWGVTGNHWGVLKSYPEVCGGKFSWSLGKAGRWEQAGVLIASVCPGDLRHVHPLALVPTQAFSPTSASYLICSEMGQSTLKSAAS